MKHELTSHIFALHIQPVPESTPGGTITISNKDFYFRIVTVLRLNAGAPLILFDHNHHLTCTIDEITKKDIRLTVNKRDENDRYSPEITCIVPLLKREALETLIDSLTQLGATTIQMTTTQKSHRTKLDQKEFDRLERIMIAAAEQSKNYNYPLLKKVESLMNIPFDTAKTPTLFLDPEGDNCFALVSKLKSAPPQSITLIIGPEGDLTPQEKAFLVQKKVMFMALTPTILRAEQAAAVALGIMRSTFNKKNNN